MVPHVLGISSGSVGDLALGLLSSSWTLDFFWTNNYLQTDVEIYSPDLNHNGVRKIIWHYIPAELFFIMIPKMCF